MKKVISIFVAVCLVMALFTVVFLSVPSAKATTFSTSTVTFDTQGGSVIDPITVVTNSQVITAPNDPSYSGHTFAGWYTEIGYVNIYDFSTIVRTDFTLYAKWTDNTPTTYAVTLGTITRVSGDTTSTVTIDATPVAAGATVTLTVLPATGMQLVPGTLVATDTNGVVATLSGTGPYIFTMPPFAVAVTATFEAKIVTHYGIWVGGVEATSANAENISGTGITGTVTYDAVNNALTLNNAQITGYYADTWSNGAGIYAATVDLKITLIGSSTINITLPFRGAGIMNQGKGVSLNGTGSLAITLGGSPSQFAMGIWSTTASYINGCTVTVTGGNTTGTDNALSSGIYVTGGTLSIANATVTAAGGTTSGSNASYGISASGLAVTNSTVTATGNTQAVSVGGYVALNGSSIMAGSSTDGTGATSVSNLTGQAGYKYVKISAPLLVNTVTFTTAGPIAKLTGDTAFTNAATGNGTGEITYSSGNTTTATVGASGEVTILAVGSTVITATQAADATYATGTATYTLTVTAPPTKYTITFSVTGANGTLGATVDTMAIATGDQAVAGKNVGFTAVPAMGYQVKAWTVDDAVEAGNVTNNLTITSLAADTAVTVEFETIPYTYSINGPEFENVTITSYTGTGGDVIIPDTLDTYPVTAIGDYAFFDCAGLTSVTIPASVTAIGDKAFSLCTGLTGILVDGSNPNYTSVDGVLYNKASTVLIQYPTGNTRTSFTIPDSVTSIGDSAFANCTSLTSVTIPVSVTSIGDSAFNACSGLTSVTIPVGVTSIGFGVFQGCSTLTSVTIPASVTSLGNDVFYYCTRLVAAHFLGNTPTTMGIDVFGHCASGFTVYYVSGTTDWTTPTWYGYPTTVEAPTVAEVAALITTISAPVKDATSLTLPTVDAGYTITIKTSDKVGVIALDGTIVPPATATTVALVFEVKRTSDSTTADTGSMNVVVPAKTVVAYAVTLGAITKVGGDDESIVIIATSPAAAGATVTLTVILKPGMRLKADTLKANYNDGTAKVATLTGTGAAYTFTMPAYAVEVTATFEAIPTTQYTLTLSGTGLTSVPAAGLIEENTSVTVTVAPAEGQQVATFTVNVTDEKAALVLNAYTFALTADTTLAVTYEAIPANEDQAAPTGLTGVAPTAELTDGTILGTTTAMEYKLAEGLDTNYVICAIDQDGLAAGKYVVRYTAKPGFNAGATTDVIVPEYVSQNEAQAAPTGLTGVTPTAELTDGTILGTTTVMQYKLATAEDATYTTCTVDQTGLVAGDYVVRLAAKIGFDASPTTAVTVPAYAQTAVEGANASITTAKGLVPVIQAVVEGTDSNLLTRLNAISGMSATGVTLTLDVAGNANVAADGTITYTNSEVAGDVIVHINKTDGTEQTATVAVTVPAHAVTTATTTTYTVTFDSQGGSAVAAITGITVGATITLPTAPTKTGYTFNGWFTAITGGTAFTVTTPVTAEVTVYAQWTVIYIFTPAPVIPTPVPVIPTPVPVIPTPVPVKKPLVLILQIDNTMFWNNSVPTKLDSTPVIKNSRTLLPLRAIIEALAGTVVWDPIAHKVTVTLGLKTVILWIGKSLATVNGVGTPIDAMNAKVVPEIINGRTMLPLRFVAENLGATVGWDPNTQTIKITYIP